jgi:hypothetical protein
MGRGRAESTLALVEAAAAILADIQPASVRAVCYQLFTRGLIPSMARRETNRISGLLTRAREEGVVPWEWIVQEGRSIERAGTWRDPAGFAQAIMGAYRRNKWAGQPRRLMVVSEKGTVRGTLGPVLDTFEIDFLPVGGYSSATRVYELAGAASLARPLLVLYLGDYDPSGMGMSVQDLPRRLASYSPLLDAPTRDAVRAWTDEQVADFLEGAGIQFRRVALTAADTRRLGRRLSFPASDKRTDTRYRWFAEHYGARCWELDALSPVDLRARVEAAIDAEIDHVAWDRYVRAEQVERASIEATVMQWNRISGLASE